MKKPPVRVHHKMLSHWQSLVSETAKKLYAHKPDFIERLIGANDLFVEKAFATGNYPFDGIAVLGHQFPSSGVAFEDLPQENLAALLEVGFFKVFMKTKENPEGAEEAANDYCRINQFGCVL